MGDLDFGRERFWRGSRLEQGKGGGRRNCELDEEDNEVSEQFNVAALLIQHSQDSPLMILDLQICPDPLKNEGNEVFQLLVDLGKLRKSENQLNRRRAVEHSREAVFYVFETVCSCLDEGSVRCQIWKRLSMIRAVWLTARTDPIRQRFLQARGISSASISPTLGCTSLT